MVIDKKSEDTWWKDLYNYDHDVSMTGFSFEKSGELSNIYG